LEPLRETLETVAKQLGIIDADGHARPDPEDIDDAYLASVSTTSRAFLVLCSSELEEFIEARCLDFLFASINNSGNQLEHNCLHALSIHFRRNLGNLIDGGGWYVDFYATDDQARKFAKEQKKRKKSNASSGDEEENEDLPILNHKNLAAKLCHMYREEVVGVSHGINDQDLAKLLAPLGFSRALVQDQCSTLMAALQSLAKARGEAAHRAAQSGGWPFKSLLPPLQEQMSLGDAWARWEAVLNSLDELEDLLMQAGMPAVAKSPTTSEE
jgi:hypothetical protein